MIKNAKSILATTSSNTSTITLPFDKTDETDTIKPMTAKPDKHKLESAITMLPFGEAEDADTSMKSVAISDKTKSGRTVPHFGKKISKNQPDRKLSIAADNVPEVNTVDEFDLEMYDTVDVSDELCHKLLESAVCLERLNDEGKRAKFYIIKTRTAFAVKNNGT